VGAKWSFMAIVLGKAHALPVTQQTPLRRRLF
jgi:hypothetical protein